MKINIWAAGKQYDFTYKQARAVYDELRELFDPKPEPPPANGSAAKPEPPKSMFGSGSALF